MVREAARESGLDWLDLSESFRPYRDRVEEIRMEGQRHPNAAGYRLIAEAAALEIERRYLGIEASTSKPAVAP